MKVCCRCKTSLSLDCFQKNRRASDGLQGRCRVCTQKAGKEYRQKYPERTRAATERWRKNNYHKHLEMCKKWREKNYDPSRQAVNQRKFKYGLTKEEFDSLLLKQNNRCAICSKKLKQKPHIDHNHRTNEVRGILCKSCNFLLGFAHDKISTLMRAICYLEKCEVLKMGHHKFVSTEIEHCDDGSAMIHHEHEDGSSHVRHAVEDLDAIHDSLEDYLRDHEDEEAKEEEVHPGLHEEIKAKE